MGTQFKDKVVAVIGASAEGGTGWHCAKRFAEEGARVIVAARTLAGVEKLAAQIGGRALRCDISCEADVAAVAAAAMEWGGLDAAINGAGHVVPSMMETFDQAMLESATTTHYFGNLYFIRHMARAMPRGGCIITMASVSAVRVAPGNLLYACGKAATMMAVQYAAVEYAPRKIRVNTLVPGLIDTPLAAPLLNAPELREAYMKETPLKAVASPVEIANAALWLSSSPSITGAAITIDNGISLRRPPHLEELPASVYGVFNA